MVERKMTENNMLSQDLQNELTLLVKEVQEHWEVDGHMNREEALYQFLDRIEEYVYLVGYP